MQKTIGAFSGSRILLGHRKLLSSSKISTYWRAGLSSTTSAILTDDNSTITTIEDGTENIGLLGTDPGLEPFIDHFRYRVRRYVDQKKLIEKYEGSLEEFALGNYGVQTDVLISGIAAQNRAALLFGTFMEDETRSWLKQSYEKTTTRSRIEKRLNPFYPWKDTGVASTTLDSLPHGIIQARSDLELKPLWSKSSSKSKVNVSSSHNLLAIPVGIKQKSDVDDIVQKFLSENFTIMLYHYDGNVDGWQDLEWSKKAIHIVAHNQTKWWFAKRSLHPAVVSLYDYIFLWDEDLGVENFHPGRYLKIVKSEGLEISQPALGPNSTEIHHKITARVRRNKFHRRIWDVRGSAKCTEDSEGPPCTGFVEGMAPVFSRSAWHCAWHLIQNDLIHGWGMDMKLGCCAQVEVSTVIIWVIIVFISFKSVATQEVENGGH